MAFILFIGFIIFQRVVELAIARSNEKWMKSRGAIEFGADHYKMIVLIHALFFVVYTGEVIFFNKGLSSWWPLLLLVFLLTQAARVWALASLGRYWNTKIIVLPGADMVAKGPYKLIKHPNYLIVAVEFIVIPLMFNALFTALIFSILNMLILSVRIPEEEKALTQHTEYSSKLKRNRRFIPDMLKKYDN